MYYKRELITPVRAKELIATNDKNRKINNRRVAVLVEAIQTNRWYETPQPISISPSGVLLDGQHRCSAIVKAQKPVVLYVAYDVPENTIFDKGLERNTRDSLYMRGIISKDVSTAFIIAMVNDYFVRMYPGKEKLFSDDAKGDFINENEQLLIDISRIVLAGANNIKDAKSKKSSISSAVLVAAKCDVSLDVLEDFCKVANSGFLTDDTQSSAIVFRNYCFENAGKIDGGSRKYLNQLAQTSIFDFVNKMPRKIKYRRIRNIYFDSIKEGMKHD